MPADIDTFLTFRNELLSGLPGTDVERIRPHLRRVSLVLSQRLQEVGNPLEDVFFIEDGLVSLTADTGDGAVVEVGMTGRDGFVGSAALLNPDAVGTHTAVVQVAGQAYRLPVAALRSLVDELPALRDRCFRYVQMLMVQSAQSVACNARHELPQRLARWLLMVQDRVGSSDLPMSQEFMAYMLGVRRAGVSVTAGALQAQGLIRQGRGKLRILDRAGLEGQACTCYRLVRDQQQWILHSQTEPR